MTIGIAHLVLVTPDELAVGFRLGGARALVARDTTHAEELTLELIADGERGVIGVYEPWMEQFDPEVRTRLEGSVAPVVVAVPAGLGDGGEDTRRARIASLVERAVGYHITFGEEGG
jgi:vacuolar-type H+-ATPase subunit F/Vma7